MESKRPLGIHLKNMYWFGASYYLLVTQLGVGKQLKVKAQGEKIIVFLRGIGRAKNIVIL